VPKGGVFPVLMIRLTNEERGRAIRALSTAPSLGLGVVILGEPDSGQVQFILEGVHEAPVNQGIIQQIEAGENIGEGC